MDSFVKKANATAFLAIQAALKRVLDAPLERETATNKQNALGALSALVTEYGVSHPASFADILPSVCSETCLKSPDSPVRMNAFYTLALLTEVLGPRLLPVLNKYLSFTVDTVLGQLSEGIKDTSMLLAALTTLKSLVEILPQFVGPCLQQVIECVFHPLLSKRKLNDRIEAFLGELRQAIAKSITPRVVLPSLLAFYQTLTKQDPSRVSELPRFPTELTSKGHVELFRHDWHCDSKYETRRNSIVLQGIIQVLLGFF
jgi:hypothetical protein